jgi:tetratricopeptide (TPR) repeat protein
VPTAPTPPARASVAPSQAVVEKLGKGDRLALAGDHRNALFAYQDAVYMQPAYAPGRVRLGRAYLALRYPAQAIALAVAALADDPQCAEARKLLEEASAAAADAIPPAPPARDPASASPPPGPPSAR